jgi:hypothetical protein
MGYELYGHEVKYASGYITFRFIKFLQNNHNFFCDTTAQLGPPNG